MLNIYWSGMIIQSVAKVVSGGGSKSAKKSGKKAQ